MLVTVNGSWKIPVGYYLINSLSAGLKMNLIQEYVTRLHDINLTVVSVICDGLRSDIVAGNM